MLLKLKIFGPSPGMTGMFYLKLIHLVANLQPNV